MIRDELGNSVAAVSEYLGIRTNNYAEYEAVILALKQVHDLAKGKLADTSVMVKMDSELVVKQMTGVYRVKNEALRELSLTAARLGREIGAVGYRAVRREHNEEADRLVNEALDAAAGR